MKKMLFLTTFTENCIGGTRWYYKTRKKKGAKITIGDKTTNILR